MQKLRQENGVEAKILTLMISDVQRITSALAYMHEVWAVPLETGMGTWLLLRQVGPSSLTVLGIVLRKYNCDCLETGVLKDRFEH